MFRPGLRNVILLLLLTTWSAAQAHCDLEALGWLPVSAAQDGCCAADDNCTQDGCALVEEAGISAPLTGALVSPPQLVCTLCLHCVWAECLADEARLSGNPPSIGWGTELGGPPETRRVAATVVWRL